MNNRQAKEKLIELFGAECFIDKLHLRSDTDRHYTGKAQYKRMKQLTYHHIKEKRNGGKATLENGAILSEENHIWFNKQTPEKQAELNRKFQEYKKCTLEFIDLPMEEISGIELKTTTIDFKEFSDKDKVKYNRAKENRKLNRLRKEYEDR